MRNGPGARSVDCRGAGARVTALPVIPLPGAITGTRAAATPFYLFLSRSILSLAPPNVSKLNTANLNYQGDDEWTNHVMLSDQPQPNLLLLRPSKPAPSSDTDGHPLLPKRTRTVTRPECFRRRETWNTGSVRASLSG